MALPLLSPPPRQNKDITSHDWQDWFYKSYSLIGLRHIETNGNPAPGGSAPTRVNVGNVTGLQFKVGDSVFFNFVIPHDWNKNTDFNFEAHFYSTNTTASRYVRGTLGWTALAIGDSISAATRSGTIDTGDILLSTSGDVLGEVKFTIPGANLKFGDHMCLQLTRTASVGSAPAIGDNPVLIHFENQYNAIINKINFGT